MGITQTIATPPTGYDTTGTSAAHAVVVAAGVTEEGLALLAPDDKPRAYLDRLLAAGRPDDVVRFLAYVLPKREAVWWAWVCARKAYSLAPTPDAKATLDAVERWIVQPTDANRRAALATAEKGDMASPAGMAAVAVYFSGGSIAPEGMPEVQPPERMTFKAVAGSITIAATCDPKTMKERWTEFAKMGLEVVERIKLFPSA